VFIGVFFSLLVVAVLCFFISIAISIPVGIGELLSVTIFGGVVSSYGLFGLMVGVMGLIYLFTIGFINTIKWLSTDSVVDEYRAGKRNNFCAKIDFVD
jgi:hypothetical protein